MRKLTLFLISCLLLTGCHSGKRYTLYFYYAKTCPVCRSFSNHVIEALEDKYGSTMQIIARDIDDADSKDSYAEICSRLENYYYSDNSGSVPFIVLDGYFARVGYNIGEKEIMLQMIEDAIEGKDLSTNEAYEDFEYYKFEDQ